MSAILFSEAEMFCHEIQKINTSYTQTTTSVNEGGGKYVYVNNQKMNDLTRLDYLALGNSPEIREIIIDCIRRYDIGCPASQVIQQTDAIQKLESELASLHGLSNSITFLSGYTANNNIIALLGIRFAAPHARHYLRKAKADKALTTHKTVFFIDKESHYSVFYAIKQAKALADSKCQSYTYNSADYEALSKRIKAFESKYGDGALKVIVSDTVSSTTGRTFDIKALCSIAKEHDAILYLDEAHAVGAMGAQGGGVSSLYEDFENYKDRVIVMGTLTKAFAQLGGYAAFNNPQLTAYFKLLSPQYIFSTTVPPWMAIAITRILHLIKGDFGQSRRQILHARADQLRKMLASHAFNTLQSNSQIVSVLVKDEQKASEVQKYLMEKNIIASLFQYPAVPSNFALIRFSLCADITEEEVDSIGRAMAAARDKIKF